MKYAVENGIIDLLHGQETIKMNKKLLGMYPWKISQGSDGTWRTYLPDAEHAGRAR
ncbi:MAG: hypothetical protein HFI88_05575 [Lachnospiraceae bacterium]|nr:hypothetical protein [Lachnospiraceae bacterium]